MLTAIAADASQSTVIILLNNISLSKPTNYYYIRYRQQAVSC